MKDDEEDETTIEIKYCQEIEMKSDKKIICVQEIGEDDSCMIVEDLKTRRIRFMHLKVDSENHGLKLIGLGLNNDTGDATMKPPHVLKFRSSARIDPTTGMWYFVGALLRVNGRVDFYSDFIYTNSWNNPNFECVDLESGGSNFWFRCVDE